jgi:hypothetical protein
LQSKHNKIYGNNKTIRMILCKELYERIKAKGKNGKLALIAICNKLLKQTIAIAINGIKYQEDYRNLKSCLKKQFFSCFLPQFMLPLVAATNTTRSTSVCRGFNSNEKSPEAQSPPQPQFSCTRFCR